MQLPLSVSRANRSRWIAAFVVIYSTILFTYPLRYHGDLLACAQDDFYYYLVIARNLAAGHGSTFDGMTLTNGYHPLYELLLWGVASVAHTLRGVYRALAVLDVFSATTIFLAARGILRKHLDNPWTSEGLALLTFYLCCFKLYHQMEVTLTLPLCFLLLLLVDNPPESFTSARWAGVGLVCAALILSRLDSGLLVGLCGVGFLLTPAFRLSLTLRKLVAFLACVLLPLGLYFAINLHFFHMLMPISGAAKQMRTDRGIHLSAVRESMSPEVFVMFCADIAALLGLPSLWSAMKPQARIVITATLLFPLVHWTLLFWISDWKLWGWYGYSLRPAMFVVLLLAGIAAERLLREQTRAPVGLATIVIGLIACLASHYRVSPVMVDVANAARGVSEFSQTHPGILAMGDRAGMVGYLSAEPVVQTEGLVMDKDYLGHIRRQEPLRSVLANYHVRYYVGHDNRTEGAPPGTQPTCFDAREPMQAGPASSVMRARFCDSPVWHLQSPTGRTMIFDLDAPDPPSAGQ